MGRERGVFRRHPGAWLASAVAHGLILPVGLTTSLLTRDQPPSPPPVRVLMRPPITPPAPPPPPPPAPAPVESSDRTSTPVPEPLPAEPAPIDLDRLLAGRPGNGQAIGGVEGGVPGGVQGGIATEAPRPPAPPPAPPPPRPPEVIRVGGDVDAPELLRRVSPVYPAAAAAARVPGLVVLELRVGNDGLVEHVGVLRTTARFFEQPAVAAVGAWQYAPLVMDGEPHPFTVVVTVRFEIG